MQITPNDVGASKGHLNSLDPKVLQLINSLANKPLLIEKLVLNQAQGVLLKIASNLGQLSLQLPLKTSNLFKNISQNNVKLSLSINHQQQVRLQLTPSNSIEAGNQPSKAIVFQKSSLLAEQILKLGNPLSIAVKAEKSTLHQSNSTASKQTQLNHSAQNPQKLKLTAEQLTKLTASSPKTNPQTSAALAGSPLRTSDPLESNLSAKVQATASSKSLSSDELTLASAAKQLLKNHFSKQLPVSKHLQAISQAAKTLAKLESPGPLEVRLQNQLKQLLAVIQKPTTHTASEIKQRVTNSGHMLEKNLGKQLVQAEQEAKQPNKLENQKLDLPPPIKTQFSIEQKKVQTAKLEGQTALPKATKKLTTEASQNNDVKLLLMKIRATLESIIKPVKPASGEQNQPQSATPTDAPKAANAKPIPAEQILVNNKTKSTAQTKIQLANQQQMVIKQANELLTEVKNIVSQIESNQLLSLKNESPNLHQFLVDLPFKNNTEIDSFEMLFERSDKLQKGQKVKRWKVVVRFDLKPLGPMFARIELENERISTHFFAREQQTAQLINQHLHVLKKSLFAAGVNIEKLAGSQGKIPERLLTDNERLVDTHA